MKLMLMEMEVNSAARGFVGGRKFCGTKCSRRRSENDENLNELTPEMEISLDAVSLELSTEESNAHAANETDATSKLKQLKTMEVSSEGEYSNVSSELSNAQDQDHETDANGIEVTSEMEFSLDAHSQSCLLKNQMQKRESKHIQMEMRQL